MAPKYSELGLNSKITPPQLEESDANINKNPL